VKLRIGSLFKEIFTKKSNDDIPTPTAEKLRVQRTPFDVELFSLLKEHHVPFKDPDVLFTNPS